MWLCVRDIICDLHVTLLLPPGLSSQAADLGLPASQKRVLGHRHTSSHPDSCLFPLPSTSYPLSPLHHHNNHHQHHQHQHHHHHTARPGIPQPEPELPRGAQDSTSTLGSIAAPTAGLFPVHAPSSLLLQSCAVDGPAGGALLPGRMEEEGACPWTAGAEDEVAEEEEEEEGAVPEEASGGSSEFQEEDSCPSVYDNLSRASLCQGMEVDGSDALDADAAAMHLDPSLIVREGAGEEEAQHSLVSSFSFSSCEVLPTDGTGDCVAECGSSPDPSLRSSPMFLSNQGSEDNDLYEGEEDDNDDDDDSGDEHIDDDDDNDDDDDGGNMDDDDDDDNPTGDLQPPNSPASCSVPSDLLLSTGSSEVFLPSGSPDPQPGSQAQSEAPHVHSHLAELRQQMTQQSTEYQATISR